MLYFKHPLVNQVLCSVLEKPLRYSERIRNILELHSTQSRKLERFGLHRALYSFIWSSYPWLYSLLQLFRVSYRFVRFNIIKHFDEISCEGQRAAEGSPQGQQPKMWGLWGGSERPQGGCRSKERCRGIEMRL